MYFKLRYTYCQTQRTPVGSYNNLETKNVFYAEL